VEMFRGDDNPSGYFSHAFTQQQEYALLSVALGVVVFVVLGRWSARGTGAKARAR